jgi:hypothetical protein
MFQVHFNIVKMVLLDVKMVLLEAKARLNNWYIDFQSFLLELIVQVKSSVSSLKVLPFHLTYTLSHTLADFATRLKWFCRVVHVF